MIDSQVYVDKKSKERTDTQDKQQMLLEQVPTHPQHEVTNRTTPIPMNK